MIFLSAPRFSPFRHFLNLDDQQKVGLVAAEKRPMDGTGASVLLVGSCARKSSPLGRHLLRRGCSLSLAAGKKEAIELLQHRQFDLVLSAFRLRDGTASELKAPFRGTDTTMFFSYAVEDSCWWITAMYRGQDRSEEAAMRPKEFTILLDEILSKKSSTSKADNNGGRQGRSVGADRPNPPANQEVKTDTRVWESKKEKRHATNES